MIRFGALLILLVGSVVLGTTPVVYAPQSYVTVPLYGAGMVSGQNSPVASTGLDDRLDKLEAKISSLESKIDKILTLLETEEISAPARADNNPDRQLQTLRTAAAKCATCHDVSVCEEKGGGFCLFTSQRTFANLNLRYRQRVIQRLKTDDSSFMMPPPRSGHILTAEEKAALLSIFETPPPVKKE